MPPNATVLRIVVAHKCAGKEQANDESGVGHDKGSMSSPQYVPSVLQ